MKIHGYPEPRVRAALPAAPLSDRFERWETSAGFLALTDTLADVLRFSGQPDAIELWIEDNDAVLQFTDRAGADLESITVRAGQFYEPRIPCSVVRGRNETAGLTARVQIVGKWAKLRGATGGSTEAPSA